MKKNDISKQLFVERLLLEKTIQAVFSQQQTVIHDSVKYCSFHEKIQLMSDLTDKIFFNDKIEQTLYILSRDESYSSFLPS